MLEQYLNGRMARIWAGVLLVSILVAIWKLISADMDVPFWGRDFSAFWSAAKVALAEGMTAPFDPGKIGPLQADAAGMTGVLYWHYPATWMAVVLPFGALSYPVALGIFTALSGAIWVLAVRLVKAAPLHVIYDLPYLSAPALWLCLAQGQNGTWVALSLGAGLVLWARGFAWVGPLVLALTIVKPHYGLLIPFIFIACGDWRAFWRTGAITAGLIGLATVVTGADYWRAFIDNISIVGAALQTTELATQQVSLFAMLQLLGVPERFAYAVHIGVVLAMLVGLWVLWRRAGDAWQLPVAATLIVAVSLPPYTFHYDLPMTVLALMLWRMATREQAFDLFGTLAMAALWITPFLHFWIAEETRLGIACVVLFAALLYIFRSKKRSTS